MPGDFSFGCFLIMYLFYLICIELFRISISHWMNFFSCLFPGIVPFHLNFLFCFKYSFIILFMMEESVLISPVIFLILKMCRLLLFLLISDVYQIFLIFLKKQHFIPLFFLYYLFVPNFTDTSVSIFIISVLPPALVVFSSVVS